MDSCTNKVGRLRVWVRTNIDFLHELSTDVNKKLFSFVLNA